VKASSLYIIFCSTLIYYLYFYLLVSIKHTFFYVFLQHGKATESLSVEHSMISADYEGVGQKRKVREDGSDYVPVKKYKTSE